MSESAVRGRANAERIAQAIDTINANAECLAAYTAAVVEVGKNQREFDRQITDLWREVADAQSELASLRASRSAAEDADRALRQSFRARLRWLVKGS